MAHEAEVAPGKPLSVAAFIAQESGEPQAAPLSEVVKALQKQLEQQLLRHNALEDEVISLSPPRSTLSLPYKPS